LCILSHTFSCSETGSISGGFVDALVRCSVVSFERSNLDNITYVQDFYKKAKIKFDEDPAFKDKAQKAVVLLQVLKLLLVEIERLSLTCSIFVRFELVCGLSS